MKYFLLLLTLLSTTSFAGNSAMNFGSLGVGATQLVNAIAEQVLAMSGLNLVGIT